MIKTIDNDLKPIFISFSGGETSGDMLLRLWNKWNGKREIIVLFANTGQEDNRTLEFVHLIETYYKIPIIWLEAIVNPVYRKGIKHKVVDYFTASRHDDGSVTPMEQKIAKLGIPNGENPDCTRDLKTRVMEHYLKVKGYDDVYTCVGIRFDEGFDRLKNPKLFYEPYHSGITKPMVNLAWENRPFRLAESKRTECKGLGLKGYEGNCRWCYKKTDRKLITLAKRSRKFSIFPKEWKKNTKTMYTLKD